MPTCANGTDRQDKLVISGKVAGDFSQPVTSRYDKLKKYTEQQL